MLLLINDIIFDFDGDEEFTQHHYDKITDEVIGTEWIVNDEDDLVDEIANVTGWCVKSVNYEVLDTSD